MKTTSITSKQCDYFRGHVVQTITLYLVFVEGLSTPLIFYDRPDFTVGYELSRDEIYEIGRQWVFSREFRAHYE